MESMDKMFPDGFLLIYTTPDSQIRKHYFNPHGYGDLADIHDKLN